MRSIGIVVALPAEARSVVRQRLRFDALHELSGGHWLAVSGAGPERAQAAAQRLIDREVQALISWGCAAAIIGRLRPGHLVLPDAILSADGQSHAADKAWRERLSRTMPVHVVPHAGQLRESPRVISTRQEKSALHQLTGAIAVDMESAAVARVAGSRQLPFLAIRAIADPAAMDFPLAVTRALNPRGDVRMASLLGHLARQPAQVGELISLGRAFGAALRTLRQVRQAAGPDFCLPASMDGFEP